MVSMYTYPAAQVSGDDHDQLAGDSDIIGQAARG